MKKFIIYLSITLSIFFFSGSIIAFSYTSFLLFPQATYARVDTEETEGTDTTVDTEETEGTDTTVDTSPGITDGIGAKKDWSALNTLAMNVYRIFLAVFSSVAVLMIIWGGIIYITSSGNPDKTEQAKKIITYAIVGIFIVGMTWGLISLTASIIN